MHESDESEDFERLANDIFDESEDQFHGFMKTKPFEIYLMTRTMSLNSLKDSMSLQNA